MKKFFALAVVFAAFTMVSCCCQQSVNDEAEAVDKCCVLEVDKSEAYRAQRANDQQCCNVECEKSCEKKDCCEKACEKKECCEKACEKKEGRKLSEQECCKKDCDKVCDKKECCDKACDKKECCKK